MNIQSIGGQVGATVTTVDMLTLAGVIVIPIAAVVVGHMLAVRREKLGAGKKVLKDVGVIKADVKDIDTRLGAVQRALISILGLFGNKDEVEKSTSPPQLTEYGQKLVTESGITDYLNKNLQRFKQEIDAKQPEFQVFNEAFKLAFRELQEETPEVNRIKDYFYQNALQHLNIHRIFALKLRDLLLEPKETHKST